MFTTLKGIVRFGIASASLAAFACAPVLADAVYVCTATNAEGTSSYIVDSSELSYDSATQQYSWTLGAPYVMTDPLDGDVIAIMEAGTLMFETDPQVNLGFSVRAGAAATDFTISSALVSFPSIVNPDGFASAEITATDAFGGDTAVVTGLDSGNVYLAQYNGFVPSGTDFSNLVPAVSTVPFGSNTVSANDGFRLISNTVSDISARVHFRLTARDLASGSTSFVITPEPTALSLLGLGALLLARRSRN